MVSSVIPGSVVPSQTYPPGPVSAAGSSAGASAGSSAGAGAGASASSSPPHAAATSERANAAAPKRRVVVFLMWFLPPVVVGCPEGHISPRHSAKNFYLMGALSSAPIPHLVSHNRRVGNGHNARAHLLDEA
ncbi:MAG: hypothetical protein EBS20_04205 [Actinobacteria bacterium]|nr:hypothetical protein [Actinomycetota bacterium]NDH94723.1 hypothetical protein [Planctomycetia bacterium]